MTSRALIQRTLATRPYSVAVAGGVAALGIAALLNYRAARRATRANPPKGKLLEIDGVRLHYLDRGHGEVLVLLHGNGTMIEDFTSSGLLDRAAKRYRVVAFDRPGFGHSSRPRDVVWNDEAQADLIHGALTELGVTRALVFGHSWGCSVAVALALNHPPVVRALVLASGYYYPDARLDVVVAAGPAVPVVGDVVRHTVSPLIARAMWPSIVSKLFDPARVPAKFGAFPQDMTFRPTQIRASAAEAALMIPDAAARAPRYHELEMPAVIIAGQEDQVVSTDKQSGRLHAELPKSMLHRVPHAGHMVHHTATEQVLRAIDQAAELSEDPAATLTPN